MLRHFPPLLSLALLASLACAQPAGAAIALAEKRVAAKGSPPKKSLIAPAGVCNGQNDTGTSAGAQRRTMRCMTDFARRAAGLAELANARKLERSANGKSKDILRCDSFSHHACDREITYWMKATGYLSARCWRVAENIAWGASEAGTAGAIFRTWMRSPGHRRNILSGKYSQIGVSLRVGSLSGRRGTHVWTQHFGSHYRKR